MQQHCCTFSDIVICGVISEETIYHFTINILGITLLTKGFIYTLQIKDLWKEETIAKKTKCWAQGMEGWRTVEDIAQLKWSLVAEGVPLMNESEIAVLVLNMLIR